MASLEYATAEAAQHGDHYLVASDGEIVFREVAAVGPVIRFDS